MLISISIQLFYLNKGLQLCDTVLLIPLAFCSFNASSIFNGLVYYSQWQRLRWYQVLLVLVGIALLLGGVLILSWRSSASNILPEEELLTSDLTQGDEDAVLLDEDVDVEAEESSPRSPRRKRQGMEHSERARLLMKRRRNTIEDEFYGV
jgi:Magnesium transporter NIPA